MSVIPRLWGRATRSNDSSHQTKKGHPKRIQILPDYLTRAFGEARDATLSDNGPPLFHGLPTAARPGLHEVRSLSGDLYRRAGYSTGDIQQLMGHTDEKITEGYLAGHETRWTEIGMVLPAEVMGGEF